MVLKKITITLSIECLKSFDIQSLAVGVYEYDKLTDSDFIKPKTNEFKVIDYLKIEEI